MTDASDNKTQYCSYYWIFEPIGGDVVDGPHRNPAFEIPTNFNGKHYNFSLFCKDNDTPEYARLIIPGLDKEEIPEEILPLLQNLKEHLLSILRIFYDSEVQLFRPVWLFLPENKPPEMQIKITETRAQKKLNAETIRSFFISSMGCREEVRLLADGIDERIPLQYRFLSYYKIIEKEFRIKGHWQIERLDEFLSKYVALFVDAGFHAKPAALLHEVRGKCAHIKTGTKKDVIGVTHLNHKEAARTERLLPILQEISIDLLNNKAKGGFFLSGQPITQDQVESWQRNNV